MSDSMESLRRKISAAGDLQSVVRTMKAMAASSITQYENAVHSLDDYYQTVQMGLSAYFRPGQSTSLGVLASPNGNRTTGVVVFGSDQGLVGQFNDVMSEFVANELANLPGEKRVWVVGERIQSRLEDVGIVPEASFGLPNTIAAITPLVSEILLEVEAQRQQGVITEVHLFHNRPMSASSYTPVSQRLLPLDAQWQRELNDIDWPTNNIAEILNNEEVSLLAFVREYIFVSLFRACAESLASENASRLSAMQRAEKT